MCDPYSDTLSSPLTVLFPSAQIISNITVLNFLQALGYLHTKEELLESELDVLKSLNFQINLPTPLAYVEMLLEVLGTEVCQGLWVGVFRRRQ